LGLLSYLAARAWLWQHLPGISCPLRASTGVPCPGCFLTRSAIYALRGDLGQSLHYHLFGVPSLAYLIVIAIRSMQQKKLYLPRHHHFSLLIILAIFIFYWLARLLGFYLFNFSVFPTD
ncbi:MAG: DUF2752 domain-containing protein, partial [Aphanocapsa feldmannii 288cV]